MLLSIVSTAAIIAALLMTEHSVWRFGFAVAACATVAAVIASVIGDFERAAALAALLTCAVIGGSRVKFHHSARTLLVADFALAFAGTVPFFFAQYRRMMLSLFAAGALISIATVAVLLAGRGDVVARDIRALVLLVCVGAGWLAYRVNGGRAAFRDAVTQPNGYVSTFAASAIDVRAWWPSNRLEIIDLANDPLPLMQPVSARSAVRPDIILIQHESVFDPRLFGLPIAAEVAAFLCPPDGISGALDVEIYGGGSWQSEFSVMTGISSAAFGVDGYYLFTKGVGRFHHSLPTVLAALGYRTQLVSSCRRSFLNYDAFYASIGMTERTFADDFPQPFDVRAFEQSYSDAEFLPAAIEAFTAGLDADAAPRFLYVLTNANHGPHDRITDVKLPPSIAGHGDYAARLSVTAATWQRMKAALAARKSARPTLIVHYGDHQPVMTRTIEHALGLAADPNRTFRTFYAIESLNFELQPFRSGAIPITALGTVLLQAAGLPLDAIAATRAHLLEHGVDASTRRTDEARLLRTLLDQGVVALEGA